MKKITGIYKITNKVNGKSYIGASIDIYKRFKAHLSNSKKETNPKYMYPLYQAFRKYSIKQFTFEVLEECNEKQLTEKERYYYDIYSPEYCLTNPHYSHFTRTPEVRKRISKGVSNVVRTKEWNEAISKGVSGKTNGKSKPVVGTNTKTNKKISFECYGDAAEYIINNNLSNSNRRQIVNSISRAVTGIRKTAYGFIWKNR